MRYDKETGRLLVSVRELVATARRGISSTLPCDSDEPGCPDHKCIGKSSENDSFSELNFNFIAGEYSFALSGKVRAYADTVELRIAVDSSPKRPKKEVTMQARGEGYVYAYMLAERDGIDEVKIIFRYVSKSTGEENTASETVSVDKLKTFFNKCKMSIIVYALPEIERVTVRLPSMSKVKFPYEKARDGQSDIVHGVYNAIARGNTLFISAPTGTGKTVSVLFPAIRALGRGKCEKVFYFTPKTTTANAAKDTIEDIVSHGADVRAVIMSSKERLCKNGLVCRERRTACKNASENRMADAVLALYSEKICVVTAKKLSEISEKYRVCPHELALSYAELCDVVVLDINYLFDPNIYIRRFFEERHDFAFLIDEAHNLPDRAREIYSAELSEDELVSPALSPIVPEHSVLKNESRKAAEEFYKLFIPYLKDNAVFDDEGEEKSAAHLSEMPIKLYNILEKLIISAENEIFAARTAKDEEAEIRLSFFKDYYHKLKRFYDAAVRFDSSYELFVFLEENKVNVRCFCLDPAHEISNRLKLGTSAVFFSGTLSPIYYYKSVLSGERNAEVIETPSPFDSGQLSVSVMDKISTRFSERERTLEAVCRAIAATVSAKRGNYMIYSPSFAYSEALAKRFSRKYPKIKVLSQRRDMTKKEKEDFLKEFQKEDKSYLVGFSVLGGIYSEGVDFSGESLIGAVIVGIGIPQLSYEREAMTAYYQDKFEEGKEFAYIYPGINKVLQAAGRVIRTEEDRGVIVLIDDRFDDPLYKKVIPKLWSDMQFIGDAKELRKRLDEFWTEVEKEKAHG